MEEAWRDLLNTAGKDVPGKRQLSGALELSASPWPIIPRVDVWCHACPTSILLEQIYEAQWEGASTPKSDPTIHVLFSCGCGIAGQDRLGQQLADCVQHLQTCIQLTTGGDVSWQSGMTAQLTGAHLQVAAVLQSMAQSNTSHGGR